MTFTIEIMTTHPLPITNKFGVTGCDLLILFGYLLSHLCGMLIGLGKDRPIVSIKITMENEKCAIDGYAKVSDMIR